MQVLPAIDLMGGEAVRLRKGERDSRSRVGDPLTLAREFAEAGAERLHVVDLDGAFAGEPRHLELLGELSAILPVQWGGGLRNPEQLSAALDAGADRVIIGTAALAHPQWLDSIPRAQLVIGVDVKDGHVAVRGWEEVAEATPVQFATELRQRGVERILCTAVHRDGTLEGPDLDVLREVSVPGMAVIASGGVGELAHLPPLTNLAGVEAVVVGKALYAGRFTLSQAMQAVQC